MSEESLLEACFIGVVSSREDAEQEQAAEDTGPCDSSVTRVTWDERNLAANDAERGIEYGTQKIEQPETPFLCVRANSKT